MIHYKSYLSTVARSQPSNCSHLHLRPLRSNRDLRCESQFCAQSTTSAPRFCPSVKLPHLWEFRCASDVYAPHHHRHQHLGGFPGLDCKTDMHVLSSSNPLCHKNGNLADAVNFRIAQNWEHSLHGANTAHSDHVGSTPYRAIVLWFWWTLSLKSYDKKHNFYHFEHPGN